MFKIAINYTIFGIHYKQEASGFPDFKSAIQGLAIFPDSVEDTVSSLGINPDNIKIESATIEPEE